MPRKNPTTFVPMEEESTGTVEVTDKINAAGEVETVVEVNDETDIELAAYVDHEKIEMLKFMEEPVTIHILDSADKNADQIFQVSVNGRTKLFERNKTYTVKRKYVETLLRARPVQYTQKKLDVRDVSDGVNAYKDVGRRGLRYPFTIVEDKNPRGIEWFKHVSMQP